MKGSCFVSKKIMMRQRELTNRCDAVFFGGLIRTLEWHFKQIRSTLLMAHDVTRPLKEDEHPGIGPRACTGPGACDLIHSDAPWSQSPRVY